MNIGSRSWESGERGLLGMAFDPNYADNGMFYLHYSCKPWTFDDCQITCSSNSDCDHSNCNGEYCGQHTSVIARYQTQDNGAPIEVHRIFMVDQPESNHNGGQILFGPLDGMLYMFWGDGGAANDPWNHAQDLTKLLGKALRVNVSDTSLNGYTIPADNPFIDVPDARPEIWAYGLRNAWRVSYDRDRPTYMFAGDVGQNDWEYVFLITKGSNYGWRAYEGSYPNTNGGLTDYLTITADVTLPIIEYSHDVGGASITGGYVMRRGRDACLQGSYVFADYETEKIYHAFENPVGSGVFEFRDTAEEPDDEFALQFECAEDSLQECSHRPGPVFSFAEDEQRDVYILGENGVFRIIEPSRCSSFTCDATFCDLAGFAPDTICEHGTDYCLVVADPSTSCDAFCSEHDAGEGALTCDNAWSTSGTCGWGEPALVCSERATAQVCRCSGVPLPSAEGDEADDVDEDVDAQNAAAVPEMAAAILVTVTTVLILCIR